MAVFINNFTSISRGTLECLKYDIQDVDGFISLEDLCVGNIEAALQSGDDGYCEWTVDTHLGIKIGDVNICSCASTSKDNIRMLRNLIKSRLRPEELCRLDELYGQYNKYAGTLLFVGIIDSFVAYEGRNAWARITPVVGFSNPIPVEEIKSFISISKTGTMTRVDETAYSRLLEIVEKYNPGIDLSKISHSSLSTTSNDYSKTTKVSKSEDAQLSYDDIQSLYPVSCRVLHAKFGKGTVIGIDGDILTISFDSGDEKRLSADFCVKNNLLERVG